MKNKFKPLPAVVYLLSFLVMVSFFSSCRSHKDLTMLRDITTQQTLTGYPEPPPDHHINDYDNLYVSIVSSNKEMNELYNPAFAATATRSSNTGIIYNEVAGQYIFGYQVDATGEIS